MNQRLSPFQFRGNTWPRAMATILILDNDLGFMFWLGQALTVTGLTPMPAPSVPEARRLLGRFPRAVDVLIVNMDVREAPEYTRSLRNQQGKLRVIATVRHGAKLPIDFKDVDAVRTKPEVLDELTTVEWRRAVRQLLPGKSGPRSRGAPVVE